jgi:hypothetical protein
MSIAIKFPTYALLVLPALFVLGTVVLAAAMGWSG